jgi:pimeloyl-ACP methyl ester carboxylesterase
MDANKKSGDSTLDRRRFLGAAGTATLAIGAAQFGMTGTAKAQTGRPAAAGLGAAMAGTAAPFGPVKQIKAGVLIVPYFRGYGTTTFLSSSTPRNIDQAAFALDILALMDVLKIEKAIMAGYDWGSRTADIIAALWPERCAALVSVTGYVITNLAANKLPIPPKEENDWWYQYYFSTERGVLGLTEYRYYLGNFAWAFNSPTWKYSEATYAQTAAPFDNPDYVPIVIGNYRWRLSLAPSEPQYAGIEKRLQEAPDIAVPTITIDGEYDPFTPAGNGSAYRDKFTGKYAHETLPVGHNVPQEAPQSFAEAVLKVDSF